MLGDCRDMFFVVMGSVGVLHDLTACGKPSPVLACCIDVSAGEIPVGSFGRSVDGTGAFSSDGRAFSRDAGSSSV